MTVYFELDPDIIYMSGEIKITKRGHVSLFMEIIGRSYALTVPGYPGVERVRQLLQPFLGLNVNCRVNKQGQLLAITHYGAEDDRKYLCFEKWLMPPPSMSGEIDRKFIDDPFVREMVTYLFQFTDTLDLVWCVYAPKVLLVEKLLGIKVSVPVMGGSATKVYMHPTKVGFKQIIEKQRDPDDVENYQIGLWVFSKELEADAFVERWKNKWEKKSK